MKKEAMYDKFLPDHHYHMLNEITPELLTALGIKGVVMDIDNTIVTYDDPEPTPEAILWLDAVTGAASVFRSSRTTIGTG